MCLPASAALGKRDPWGLASLSSQTNELLAPLLEGPELSLCLFSKHLPSFFLPKRGKSKSVLSSRDSLKVRRMPSWSLKPHPGLLRGRSPNVIWKGYLWGQSLGERKHFPRVRGTLQSSLSYYTPTSTPAQFLFPIHMSHVLRYLIFREHKCAECLPLHWELESVRGGYTQLSNERISNDLLSGTQIPRTLATSPSSNSPPPHRKLLQRSQWPVICPRAEVESEEMRSGFCPRSFCYHSPPRGFSVSSSFKESEMANIVKKSVKKIVEKNQISFLIFPKAIILGCVCVQMSTS